PFTDVAIYLGLELVKRPKTAQIELDDKLPGVGDLLRLRIELDAIATKQRTIARPSQQAEHQLKPDRLVARHWQQQRLAAFVRIDDRFAGFWIDHPVVL